MKEFIIENLLAGSTVSFFDVAIKLFMALLIGVTIYIAYYFTSSKVSYNSNFNLSLVAMAIITTAIMAVITNNIALSLGMVGALSIIRFRTAIKDPRDAMFSFGVLWLHLLRSCTVCDCDCQHGGSLFILYSCKSCQRGKKIYFNYSL